MPRSWRSEIADEVRACSMMNLKDGTPALSVADIRELRHIMDGGKYCLDGRKERRLKRLGLLKNSEHHLGQAITDLGKKALHNQEPKTDD